MLKKGIRRRFLIAISTLVGLVLIIETAVLVYLGRLHVREEIEQRARSYAELAAEPICQAYAQYAESGISKFHNIVHDKAQLNHDLRALAIYNTEGEVVFHSDELEIGARTNLFYLGDEIRGPLASPIDQQPRFGNEAMASGENFYVARMPYIEEWGAFRYTVAFYFSYDDIRTATRAMAWQIGGLGVFALLLGVAFAWVLSAQSLVLVERLTSGAQKLADGELEHRIDLKTGDEFEVLGESLDLMASRLRATIGDLETSNDQLNQLNEELQQIDRVKGDLLANVSHELRTPLTAISGYIEAMQEGLLGELDHTQKASLEIVERNIRRLRGMIDQLLSYSRTESGRLKIELRPFDLEALIHHVTEALAAIHGPELNLNREMPPGLPDVYGDAGHIAQVIENLLTNAIKFSPDATPITLRISEVPHGIEISVSDRGIGIPAEARTKIFERFYQIDASSRRKFGGMGLGLAIVREILELNHSEIQLESRVGEGSTFRFVLPIASERTGKILIQGRFRIALIDDDAGFVQGLAAHLSDHGFVIETAATAEQGFEVIGRVNPDAVVLDRLLPDSDGFDLLTRLVESPKTRDIPVILVTIRPERALGMRLGAADYLVKPVEPEVVRQVLDKLLYDARNDSRRRPTTQPMVKESSGRENTDSGEISL